MEMSSRSTRRHYSLLFFIVLFLSCFHGSSSVSAQSARPKNVQVSLRAKWPGTSLLLEAGELLSKEWKGLFWDFTEVWFKAEKDIESRTAKHCVGKIIGALPEVSTEFLIVSPIDRGNSGEKTQISVGKCCWVDIGGTLFFDVVELSLWLDAPSKLTENSSGMPERFDFDHVHSGPSVGKPVAILYGALGTDCFTKFHNVLGDASTQGRVKYVVRPVLLFGCEKSISPCGAVGTKDPLNLGGYGVELALKNMEYKAMDDSAIKKGVILEDPHTEDLSQEVRGFIFSKILEHKPEITAEVMAFRDYLLSSTISDTLEVWELKDLGHQTAQRIVHASDPLQSMQEINQNFPSVVSSLS